MVRAQIGNAYAPDRVSAPGETLEEVLAERQMSPAALADRMGCPEETIHGLVKGAAALTPETAQQLEQVLGIAASFWNNLERHYRESLASQGDWAPLEGCAGCP